MAREQGVNRSGKSAPSAMHLYKFFLPFLLLLPAAAPSAPDRYPRGGGPAGEWHQYGGDSWSTKYSPLDQIDRRNFRRLQVAWRWESPDNLVRKRQPELKPGPYEATPLMVDGTLYTPTSMNRVVAIDAATGAQRWMYDPGSGGHVHRGVAYWRDPHNPSDRRILMPTSQSYLIALDAATGRPIPTFGANGRIDLLQGLRRPVPRHLAGQTSPPLICGDVVVVGGAVDDWLDQRQMPPGDVCGYDIRTGRRLWIFHTVPQLDEPGNNTWLDESWKYTGNTNVWTWMSYDPELHFAYLPVSTPTNDWYGGHRRGAGLFGESLVCLDVRTGRRVWHYQFVHHGLWDYDPPCAPNLLDVTFRGRRIKAVAQVTKQAYCFVFNRETGEPLWPVEERPVAPSRIPREAAWPTQPHPTRPAPFDRQGVTENDLIDFTPELENEAREILKDWVYGPLYTPPADRPTILMPGWVGGASWAGASVDPETGWLYVPSITNAMWLEVLKPSSPGATVDRKVGRTGEHVDGPRGLPLFKPPYGRITAIDLNSGEHRWMTPLGEGPRSHPAIKHLDLQRLGWWRRGYLVTTRTLLLAIQEGSWFNTGPPIMKPVFGAYDKRNGRLLGEVDVPAPATGAPLTYMAGGRQFIVYPTGGGYEPAGLIALALPAE